jgi:hypothetical protein
MARIMTQVTADTSRVTPAPPESLPLWAAGLLFLALTLAATWPLSQSPATLAFRNGADTDLVAWILGWDAHAFLHQPFSIFDANVYYPERHTLAFAENLIGSAFLAAPVIWITGNVVLGMSAVVILSCALCGLGAYFLGRRLGMGASAALVTGMVFAFAPPHFGRLAQPHLNAVQWLPFGLASLHGYLDAGRRRDLWLAAAFFSLQVLSSGHGAVYLLVSTVALLAYRVAMGEPVAPLRRLRDFGVVGVLAILPSMLVMLPYRSIQKGAGLHRTLTPDWAPPAINFLSSNTHFHQYLTSLVPSLEINQRATGVLFMGILPMVLALVALWPRVRRGPRPPEASGHEAAAGTPDGDRAAAGRARGGRAGTAWRILALVLDLAVLAALAIAIYRVVNGPFKIRWDRQVVFSVREAWRPWLAGGIAVALRASAWRRVPFDPFRWLRVAAGWGVAFGRWLPPAVRRWRAAGRGSALAFYSLLGLGGVMLAGPPPIGIWPYVYWLPGFNMVRVPARFTIIVLLALAVLAGLGFERLASSMTARRRRGLAAAAIMFLVLEYSVVPLKPQPYSIDIPPIDRWLNTLPKPFAIAEVPLAPLRVAADISPFEKRQAIYMLHSMGHWQKTVHAFSGFRTWFHEDLFAAMQAFPDQASLDMLTKIEVKYVVVHTDYYPPGEWDAAARRLAAFGDRLRLLHVEGAGRVYELRR